MHVFMYKCIYFGIIKNLKLTNINNDKLQCNEVKKILKVYNTSSQMSGKA